MAFATPGGAVDPDDEAVVRRRRPWYRRYWLLWLIIAVLLALWLFAFPHPILPLVGGPPRPPVFVYNPSQTAPPAGTVTVPAAASTPATVTIQPTPTVTASQPASASAAASGAPAPAPPSDYQSLPAASLSTGTTDTLFVVTTGGNQANAIMDASSGSTNTFKFGDTWAYPYVIGGQDVISLPPGAGLRAYWLCSGADDCAAQTPTGYVDTSGASYWKVYPQSGEQVLLELTRATYPTGVGNSYFETAGARSRTFVFAQSAPLNRAFINAG